ncbi:AraC family transcriptional regulator [Pedobacter sp. PF22-3]|uniref:helix-turn-helix transcriptional regulator n=1 Tax=Pedobacter sp. PF22-3 TaxID=2994467 RepID=UPI002246E633|nr:AraC family transcriptional regulator [Pedobacter sp. PF22-3]MCX2491901.1 AraC family transcriptional regulator [Pedobacter sp. PF22-3]
MEIKLSTYPKRTVIYECKYIENFNAAKDVEDTVMDLAIGRVSLNIIQKWFSGIHITIAEINPQQDESFCLECSQHHIGFLFCLNGAMSYCNSNQQANFLSLVKNEQDFNIGRVKSIIFNVKEKTRYVYIQLTEQYFGQVTGKEPIYNIKTVIHKAISPEIGLVLQQIIQPKYEGRVKRLFLEARIFDLIIAYFNQLPEKETRVIKKDDIEKIMLAKQLVECDLQKPNSLTALSRKVGINDYKLKIGFKELTGHTVFGYLYKIRMEKAHHLLSKEKKTVNEVSFLVGYKNAQHFITAFKKQYHILPGSLNKT